MLDLLHQEAGFSGSSDGLLVCVRRGVQRGWRQTNVQRTDCWDSFFGEHGAARENAGKDGATHMDRMPQSIRSVVCPVQKPEGAKEKGKR